MIPYQNDNDNTDGAIFSKIIPSYNEIVTYDYYFKFLHYSDVELRLTVNGFLIFKILDNTELG
jgi:hypothetical protein